MFEKFRVLLTRHLTLANLLDRCAVAYRERTAAFLEEPRPGSLPLGTQISYPELRDWANRVAHVLRSDLSVSVGDRVVLATSNRIDLLLAYHAVVRLGGIPVPVNPMLKAEEVRHIVTDAGAQTVVTDPEVFARNLGDPDRIPEVRRWGAFGPPEAVRRGFVPIDRAAASAPRELEPVEPKRDAPAGIFYTSGTTGKPKGAVLTHKNLLSPPRLGALFYPIPRSHRLVMAMPLAHMAGFAAVLAGWLGGASVVFIEHFDAERVLKAIERYEATAFLGVPAMYALLLQAHPEGYDLSSMKVWVAGADAVPEEHIRAFLKLGGKFVVGYGQVETSAIIAVKLYRSGARARGGTLGFPLPGIRTRIVDDAGRAVGRGGEGELLVRGPGITPGYWKGGKAQPVRDDGWHPTGDLVRRDWLGFLHFVDRKKDVIKCGGYSVFSQEVEEELRAHRAVAEAAVVGVPHAVKGEVPVAFVTLKPAERASAEEILEWAKQEIAGYKAPRDVRIVKEFPRGGTHKVLKRELREAYLREGVPPRATARS